MSVKHLLLSIKIKQKTFLLILLSVHGDVFVLFIWMTSLHLYLFSGACARALHLYLLSGACARAHTRMYEPFYYAENRTRNERDKKKR